MNITMENFKKSNYDVQRCIELLLPQPRGRDTGGWSVGCTDVVKVDTKEGDAREEDSGTRRGGGL